MDKLKNVLSPGFKDQDDLLYDTGASKKTSHEDDKTPGGDTTSTSGGLSHSGGATSAGTSEQGGIHSSVLGSSTSRTATNQKDHMAPQDFEAARTVGTGAATSTGSNQAHQPSNLGSETTTNQGALSQAQHGDLAQPRHGDLTQSQPGHTDHSGQDTAIGAGTIGAAVGAQQHHEHSKHNKIQKENPLAATPNHPTGSEHHHQKTERDTSVGSSAFGATGTSHDHHKHDSEKEPKKDNIFKKIFSGDSKHEEHKDVDNKHESHTGRNAAVGAGAVGAAGAAHEHNKHDSETEPKKDNIFKKIFSSSSNEHKHDEHVHDKHAHDKHSHGSTTGMEPRQSAIIGTTHHQPHSAYETTPSRDHQADSKHASSSAQAVAPLGVGASAAAIAETKHHSDHAIFTVQTPLPLARSQHDSIGQSTHQHGHPTQQGSLPVADQFTHQESHQQHNLASGTRQSASQQSHQPHGAGIATAPLGIGAIGAVVGAHEHQKHSQQTSQQNDLTHHQHNSGTTLSHNQASIHQHEHSHKAHQGVVGESHHSHSPEQINLTGHEQRDLHQHGGNDTGLSHHVHNGVTPLPHRSHDHSHSRIDDNASQNRDASGSAIGAGVATAGIAATSASHHDSRNTEDLSHTTSTGSGPASKTQGPHSSNILNVLDPRVKPDVQALKEDKEAKKTAHVGDENQSSSPAGSTQTPTLTERLKSVISPSSSNDPIRNTTEPTIGPGSGQHLGTSPALRDDPKATEITNQARGGDVNPRVAVAGSGAQDSTGHTFATSGAAGTHNNPAHTEDITGVVSGERGNVGNPSNVYSRKPLDDRVTMPGAFPESSTNIHKTT